MNRSQYLAILLCVLSLNTFAELKPIIIGLNADLSAVAAEGGVAIQRGAQLAIDEINASGGVLGRPLALQVRDHRGNPARGLSNMKKFAAQKDVIAVLGGVHTPVVLHELAEVHTLKMIYLIPWAAGTPIVDNGFTPNYVFRLSVRDQHAGHVLMTHAKKRKLLKVGLLLERTGWGRSNEKSMTAAAKKLGLTVTDVAWFNWREESMGDQLDRLEKSGSEVILLVANAPEGAVVVKNMLSREPERRTPILSHWGISTGAFVKKVGLDDVLATDISVLQTYSFLAPNDRQKMHSVLYAYKNKFDPTVTAESIPATPGVVHAYDLVSLLSLAIQKANILDRGLVRTALENIDRYPGLFKTFEQPFTKNKHDALTVDDYTITKYNDKGYLVPVDL